MLEVKDLNKTYGPIHAVRGVSFQVNQGEVLGFLGPNGAGKTTTMRMITGFLPPTSGTAIIAGHDIVAEPILAKKQIGYLPENAPVYGDMTVWNYLAFIAEIRGYSGRRRDQRLDEIIETCRLQGVKNQSIGTLSKGFKQRACFAQALIHDPPVLIMDEPTDGLDPNQKHLVRTLIRDMAKNKVIVLSTHILEEVDAVCTRAIIIAKGTVVANGTPAELRARSQSHGAVELTVKALSDDMAVKLKALKAARTVDFSERGCVIYPKMSDRLFEETLALIKANPAWQVTGLKTLEGRLDDVFRDLTLKDVAAKSA